MSSSSKILRIAPHHRRRLWDTVQQQNRQSSSTTSTTGIISPFQFSRSVANQTRTKGSSLTLLRGLSQQLIKQQFTTLTSPEEYCQKEQLKHHDQKLVSTITPNGSYVNHFNNCRTCSLSQSKLVYYRHNAMTRSSSTIPNRTFADMAGTNSDNAAKNTNTVEPTNNDEKQSQSSKSNIVMNTSNTNTTTTKSYNYKEVRAKMDQRKLFQYLQFKTFAEEEIGSVFDKIIASSSSYTNSHDIDETSSTSKYNTDTPVMTTDDITTFLLKRIGQMDQQFLDKQNMQLSDFPPEHLEQRNEFMSQYAKDEASQIVSLLQPSTRSTYNINSQQQDDDGFLLTKKDFTDQIQTLATSIDTSRTIPLSLSMLLVGSSVGIVIPIMPYVVSNLGLTAGQYGIVVSSFAIAKLFANVPAAIFAEKHGRKPYLVYSLVVISMGVGGVGLASQFEHLVLCRLMTGIGVSALSTAATLTIADCSTPLNRASTMAPMMSAFAAGTALGPAIGGILADKIGVSSTFYLVGCSYLALTLMNRTFLKETKMVEEGKRIMPWQQGDVEIWNAHHQNEQQGEENGMHTMRNKSTSNESGDSMVESVTHAVSQWSPLLANPKVRNVVIINGFYWVSLAGSQMTLLPLILTDPNGLALSATSVGKVYMGMSLVQVLGNPTMAKFIDTVGKAPGIVIGCSLLSASMFHLPYCDDMTHVAGTLGFWALGSTMLSTAPVSYVSDTVSEGKRAQAIALLRTAGDVGFLIGASGAGAVADLYDMDVALHSSAGLLLTATSWFAARRLLLAPKGQ